MMTSLIHLFFEISSGIPVTIKDSKSPSCGRTWPLSNIRRLMRTVVRVAVQLNGLSFPKRSICVGTHGNMGMGACGCRSAITQQGQITSLRGTVLRCDNPQSIASKENSLSPSVYSTRSVAPCTRHTTLPGPFVRIRTSAFRCNRVIFTSPMWFFASVKSFS